MQWENISYLYNTYGGTTSLTKTYTYDSLYRLTKTAIGSDETSYTYDEVVNNTTYETTGHYYNGMEQRVRKTVDGDTTKYIYAGSQLLFTTDGNNAKLTENILSPNGQVIAGQRFDGSYAGEYYFYNQDIRNSTMSILSDSYGAVKYYEYNEYGKQAAKGNSSFINDLTYTGAVAEGGNVFYMNARFYDANNGRFLTQDTYKGNAYEPWSQNLDSYVGNNPINYVDPTGHSRKGNQEDKMKWWEVIINILNPSGCSGCSTPKDVVGSGSDAKDTVDGLDAINKAAEETNAMSYLTEQNDHINSQRAADAGSAELIILEPLYLADVDGVGAEEMASRYRDDLELYMDFPGTSSSYVRQTLDYMTAVAGKSGLGAAFDLLKDVSNKVGSPLEGYYAALEEINSIDSIDVNFVLIEGDMGTK